MKVLFVLAAIVATALAADVSIVRSDQDIRADGSFNYAYETSDGSTQQVSGDANSIKGSYKWLSPEGETVEITYVADENGYQPAGAHIPVGPPTPDHVVRALAWIAAHPSSR